MDLIDEIKAAILWATADPRRVTALRDGEQLWQWKDRAVEEVLQPFRVRLAVLEALEMAEHQPKETAL